MHSSGSRINKFKTFILENKYFIFLLMVLLIGVNILVLNKISFIFIPLGVLVKTIVLPILLSGIAFYLLNPIVNFLEKKKIPRIYSIFLIFLLIIGVLIGVIMIVIPLLRTQLLHFFENFPSYIRTIEQELEQNLGKDIIQQFRDATSVNTDELVNSFSQRAMAVLQQTWSGIGGVLSAVKNVVLAIIMLPFILFYLLKDGRKLPSYMVYFLPTKLRTETLVVLKEANDKISSYIRGQIIVSLCIGVLLYIGYQIIGLDYSLILAIAAACTAIVPFLGPAIAITPAIIVAAVTSPLMLLKMIAVWTVVQLVEGKLISPQIMGKSLSIHPITIIFVILTSGNLFGVVGVVLAVPGYAVIKVFLTHIFKWFKKNSGLYA